MLRSFQLLRSIKFILQLPDISVATVSELGDTVESVAVGTPAVVFICVTRVAAAIFTLTLLLVHLAVINS